MSEAVDAIVLAIRAGMFSSHPEDSKTARYILEGLRALPARVRMEAMGMAEVNIGHEADPWYVEPFEAVEWDDDRTYWTEP